MVINEYVKDSFKAHLDKKYESFKKFLCSEGFCPDAEEVLKMYSKAFYENSGAYDYVKELLGFEMYDSNGKLNELGIYLDEINRKYSDYCAAYNAALMKKE